MIMNKEKPLLKFATVLMLAAVLNTNAAEDPLRASDSDAPSAVTIKNEADLREYLASEPANSPFGYFSAGTKQRFIEGLRFGATGLATFDRRLIQDELTEAEARELLALFGLQEYASSLEGLRASRDSAGR